MQRSKSIVIAGLILAWTLFSCGGAETPAVNYAAADYFPAQVTTIGWDRTPELRNFVGDSLYEYINGGAELYHMYDFIEVTVADYHKGEGEIVADLYRFADADRAYGMFTTLRPEEPEAIDLGVEGFSVGPSLLFVKGDYLANFVGYDESTETIDAIRVIADTISQLLPGTTAKPSVFTLFPPSALIAHTEKIFAQSFMGREYLTNFYCADCVNDGDTLTLFLANDESGAKYLQWSEQTAGDRATTMSAEGLPYDEGNAFIIVDDYYGHIVAGLKIGTLVGAIGSAPKHAEFLAGWLETLQ